MALAGYGTQFTIDLEEGPRIVDSPLDVAKSQKPTADAKPALLKPAAAASSPPSVMSLERALSHVPFSKGTNAGKPMGDLSNESLQWIVSSKKAGANVKLMAELVLKGRANKVHANNVAEAAV